MIIRRLQLLRATQPARVKVISDNPKHAAEEVALSEIEIVGEALCCLIRIVTDSVKNREKRRAVVSAFRSRRVRGDDFPLSVADGFQARARERPQVDLFRCYSTTSFHRGIDGSHGDACGIAAP